MTPGGITNHRPYETFRSFAGLFVAAWFVNAATFKYSFAAGTIHVNQPVALLLAALATYRYGLLGRRWRPRGSLIVLAAILPGGISLAFLSGLLGHDRVSTVASGISQAGPFVLALWWLWLWGSEFEFARRRAKLCLILVGAGAAAAVLASLLASWWAPAEGWPEHATGFIASGVPLSLVSAGQGVVLVALTLVTASLLVAFVLVPASVLRAAQAFSAEAPLERPQGAGWVEPPPRARRHALLLFLWVGLLGFVVLVGSNLAFVPLVQAPTWILAPLPWVLAAWLASRWFDACSGAWVAKSGLLADNRFSAWSSFSSWDASFDRFTLQGATGPRVIPIEDSDPRRGVIEQWIVGDATAPAELPGDPSAPAAHAGASKKPRRRAVVIALVAALFLSAPWWWGPAVGVLSPAFQKAQLQVSNRNAVSGLQRIMAAQATFRASRGRFASVKELEESGVIAPDGLPEGIYFGGQTTKATPAVAWWAVAAPWHMEGSFLAFYTNETGKIWSLPIQSNPEGGWSIPTPNDFGDKSAPPPKATLYTGP